MKKLIVRPKLLSQSAHFDVTVALSVLAVIVLVGTVIIFRGRAAGPFASLDLGAASTVASPATSINDGTASGGSYVQFGSTTPAPPPPSGSRCPAYPAMPSPSCTGVPSGVTLTPTGTIWATQDNAVIEGMLVNGDIVVTGNNVTIKNSKIVGGRINSGYGRPAENGRPADQVGLVVMDVEFDGQGKLPSQSAIGDHNYTCIRCYVHGTGNGPRAGGNVLVEDSYVADLCCYLGPDDHRTAFGSNYGNNITVRHNYFDCNIGGCSSSASFYGQQDTPVQNVTVEKNLFNTATSHYCLWMPDNVIIVRDNIFGQKYSPTCGSSGPVFGTALEWTNNRYEDGTQIFR